MIIQWNNAAQSIAVDVTLSERHSRASDVTEDPVEAGSSTTDSSRDKSDTLSAQIFFADEYELNGNTVNEPGRAVGIWQQLDKLRAQGERMRVTCGSTDGFGASYENMVIVTLDLVRDSKSKGAVTLDVTFREIRVVSSATVPIQKAKETKQQPKAKTGDQNTNGLENDGPHKSTLKKMKDGLSRFLKDAPAEARQK